MENLELYNLQDFLIRFHLNKYWLNITVVGLNKSCKFHSFHCRCFLKGFD